MEKDEAISLLDTMSMMVTVTMELAVSSCFYILCCLPILNNGLSISEVPSKARILSEGVARARYTLLYTPKGKGATATEES